MNGVFLNGVIKEVRPLISKKDGKHFANECDVESVGKGGKRIFLSLTDFDIKVKYAEDQKLINLPVFGEAFGKSVVYHPVAFSEAFSMPKVEDKKATVKV